MHTYVVRNIARTHPFPVHTYFEAVPPPLPSTFAPLHRRTAVAIVTALGLYIHEDVVGDFVDQNLLVFNFLEMVFRTGHPFWVALLCHCVQHNVVQDFV